MFLSLYSLQNIIILLNILQGITGWIGPVKTCFTVDCGNCSCVLRASDNSDPIDVNAYQIEKEQAELKSLGKLGGDPVPCCVYSDPNNYYTKPLDTEAVNPEGPSPFCEDTLYGLQKIGSWYVTSLYNMCYFQPHYAVSQ